MTMKSSTRQVDGIAVVDLSGRITLGEGSVVLRDLVRDLLTKGSKKILLNLGDVTYIDSSGIGELVSAFTTVRNGGGDLKLLNLTKKVHDLLQITKLYTVFDIKDDQNKASFQCQTRVMPYPYNDITDPLDLAAMQGRNQLRDDEPDDAKKLDKKDKQK